MGPVPQGLEVLKADLKMKRDALKASLVEATQKNDAEALINAISEARAAGWTKVALIDAEKTLDEVLKETEKTHGAIDNVSFKQADETLNVESPPCPFCVIA